MLAFVIGAAAALGPARRADAFWYDPFIFDPQALVQNVQRVAQLAQQVAAAVEQVQNQLRSRARLNGGVAPDVPAIVNGIRDQFDADLYDTPRPADQLNDRFPPDMGGVTWTQYQRDQAAWQVQERQALVENRRLQNQVYRDMDETRQRVQRIVEASNAAPGETAAIQAHNDLLAAASGELAKLQALKASRSRLKTERLARQQSESSFAAAECERVRSVSDQPPPTGTVVDPFQD